MKASFDLSSIGVLNWMKLMEAYTISEPVKTDKGWVWPARYTDAYNFVVTSCNPITGEYYYDRGTTDDKYELGYAGYVGIEGDTTFVANFFVDFKKACGYYKGEDFGNRSYI